MVTKDSTQESYDTQYDTFYTRCYIYVTFLNVNLTLYTSAFATLKKWNINQEDSAMQQKRERVVILCYIYIYISLLILF